MLFVTLLILMSVWSAITSPISLLSNEGGMVGGDAAGAVLTTEGTGYSTECALLLLTNIHTNPHHIHKVLRVMPVTSGVTVFEALPYGRNISHSQSHFLSATITHIRQVREWRCVTIIVVSDSVEFLVGWGGAAFSEGLLTWPTRILAITSLPITHLNTLHHAFSQANALAISCPTTKRCGVFSYIPYNTDTQVIQVAKWTSTHGLSLTSQIPLFHQKFHTFSPRPTLVVAAEEFPPHLLIKQGQSKVDFNVVGPMVSLHKILAQSLNFSYTFKRPPDGSWGTKLSDGTWTGMVGMVKRQEADISLGPFGMSAVRAEAVDFTVPILIDYARILASRGRPEVDPWGFWLPLTPLVWVAFMGSMLLLVLVVFLGGLCFDLKEGVKVKEDFVDTAMNYLRVFLQQDVKNGDLRWWSRLVLGGWMLLTLVLTRSYSSTLMSLLAVRYIPQPIQTLTDLLQQPDTAMIWEANTVYVQYYRSVVSGVFLGVRDADREGRIRFIKTTQYNSALDQLVRPGSHAIIFEDLSGMILKASDFSRTGRCDFYSSRERFLPFMFCMIAQKHNPLIHSINSRVKRMTEAGLYDHWLNEAIPNSTTCLNAPTTVTVTATLSLTNTWGMFVLLGLGLLLALLVFAIELIATICL